jgi:hypothetical protein
MIDTNKALATVKQYFPKMTDQQLMEKIEAFARKHPNLTDEQAMAAFQQALKHPKVAGMLPKKTGIQKYLGGQ